MNPFTRIGRWLTGPTSEQISARSQAMGGPPYPIPPMDTRPPTLADASRLDLDAARALFDRSGTPVIVDDVLIRPWAADRLAAADTIRNARTGDTMSDPTDRTPIARADADIYDQDTDPATPTPDPVVDSGVHAVTVDGPALPTVASVCPTCNGKGHVERTVNDLLRESVGLIPVDGGDMVIKEFYTRLLRAAPDLAALFPRDLLTAATQDGASPGAMQRDRLLQALVALADLYGAGESAMAHLDTALAQFGRSHAAFARPDGTTRGATVAEYMAVKDVLFGTLVDVAGDAWRGEYTTAWSEAYDHAMVHMLYAQYTSGMRSARYPRRDADHG